MNKTLQVRDVPPELHHAVRARAVQAGQSVSDYLRELLSEIVLHPTMDEIVARSTLLANTGGGASRADIRKVLREGRDR